MFLISADLLGWIMQIKRDLNRRSSYMLNARSGVSFFFFFFFYLAGFGSALRLWNYLHCDNSVGFFLHGKIGAVSINDVIFEHGVWARTARLTRIFWSWSTVWFATLFPLISAISSPSCKDPEEKKTGATNVFEFEDIYVKITMWR